MCLEVIVGYICLSPPQTNVVPNEGATIEVKISENDCSSDEAGTSSGGTALFVNKVIKISL